MKNVSTAFTKLNDLSDEELITRTQNGNTEAFTPLVNKYQQRI